MKRVKCSQNIKEVILGNWHFKRNKSNTPFCVPNVNSTLANAIEWLFTQWPMFYYFNVGLLCLFLLRCCVAVVIVKFSLVVSIFKPELKLSVFLLLFTSILKWYLACWPCGPKHDCYARGLGFDFQVDQSVIGFFYEILSSSLELRFVPG